MIAQLRQIVLEHLLEELQGLFDLPFVERVERHDWVLGDHVAESYEG